MGRHPGPEAFAETGAVDAHTISASRKPEECKEEDLHGRYGAGSAIAWSQAFFGS